MQCFAWNNWTCRRGPDGESCEETDLNGEKARSFHSGECGRPISFYHGWIQIWVILDQSWTIWRNWLIWSSLPSIIQVQNQLIKSSNFVKTRWMFYSNRLCLSRLSRVNSFVDWSSLVPRFGNKNYFLPLNCTGNSCCLSKKSKNSFRWLQNISNFMLAPSQAWICWILNYPVVCGICMLLVQAMETISQMLHRLRTRKKSVRWVSTVREHLKHETLECLSNSFLSGARSSCNESL